MADEPKKVGGTADDSSEESDWLPTSTVASTEPVPERGPPSLEELPTIVDPPRGNGPVVESPTNPLGEPRPFATTCQVQVDDVAVQQFMDRALVPPGGRLISYGEFARGGMGVIERIDDRVLRRQTAVKVLRDEYRLDELAARDFVREAQITGQLEHPNIIPVYELSSTPDGRLCITMRLVEGHTLGGLIEALPAGPLGRGRLLDLIDIILRVCDALAFAHSRGVVHCDLKPGNVMVAAFGQVYLMDWGIARLTACADDAAGRPVTCSVEPGLDDPVRGTPSCMAPEQALGRPADERTDVFGVGALLYSILCRRPPYPGRDPERAVEQAKICDWQPIDSLAPDAAPGLVRILRKAMTLEPDDRYPSVLALQRDLVRFVRGGSDFPRVRIAAGDTIVQEGELGDAAYIIEQGRCAVLKEVEGQPIKLREMGPGEVFGETAILAASARTASVVALDAMVLLKVTREVLEEEVGAMKPWMSVFIRTLAERFREREMGG